jgi:hypothetical protein
VRSTVHFIPLATTLLASVFTVVLLRRWNARRSGPHLLWWALGAATFAAGTITESLTTLFGWDETVFRWWYVTGALLGGAPLAQGSVYLLMPRRVAHIMTAVLVSVIAVASVFVFLSPVNAALAEPHRLSGAVFEWQWVRAFSPFINIYAVIFLVGGAFWSAYRYAGDATKRHRATGNLLIAIGALLPGIGGTFTRFGVVEVLYVTEFIGLALIVLGFHHITSHHSEISNAAIPQPS